MMYFDFNLKGVSMRLPTIEQINKYCEFEPFNDLLGYFFNKPWMDTPRGAWMIMAVHALVERAEVAHKKARIAVKLPEGTYAVFDIDPHAMLVLSNTMDDPADPDVFMNNDLNSLLTIDEWENCDYHKQSPELSLVHAQSDDEIFEGTKKALSELTIVK